MKKNLTKNIPLKIMSIIVGILVWLIVVNVDDPIITKGFVISDVQIINEAYVDQLGEMVMQDDRENSVRVYITGERKIVNRLTSSDIKAVADLQQAQSTDTDPVMIPITATCAGVLPENIRVSPQNLSVHLEKKVTKEFAINVSCGDSKPAQGLEIASLTANPEKVRITGPKSLVNKIDKVNAAIELNGKTQDFTQEVTLSIIDKNQEALSDSEMNSLRIENNAQVIVTAKLWKIRQGVKISAGYVGTPAEGYQAGMIKTVPDTISVAGSTEGLETLAANDNVITIPSESIDISGESSDVEKKISLKDLLPDNVKLTSDSSEDVWVTVSILPEGSREFSFPTKEIKVKNKPDDLQVTFETAQIAIRIKSDSKDLDDLDVTKDIKASIDLEDKEEGNYEVPVTVSLPDGYEIVENVSTEVVISSGTVTEGQ